MSARISILFTALLLCVIGTQAQTIEDLKKEKAEKVAQASALQAEIAAIDKKIATYPGWKFDAFGTIGVNFAQFDNWVSTETPNTFTSSYGFSGNALAKLDREKYFWNNAGNLNFVKTKLDTDTRDSIDQDFEATADALNVTSLFGYKLSPKWALSTMGEYRTTVLSNFNNPGYIDLGIGATWTPITNLVVVMHPLNYNIVMAKANLDYESSLGCKLLADYTQSLPLGVSWKSNLSAFISYSDVNNLTNWTWVNGLSATIWKGLGVGFEVGLRGNRQEDLNYNKANFSSLGYGSADEVTFDNLKEKSLQKYWLLGLTYNL